MRIIFSRKGFDGTYGGVPSPIINGRPTTLPIPTRQPTVTTYGDLAGNRHRLVEDLTRDRLGAGSPCHVDPDIDAGLLPRRPGWRGAFGQVAAAASHLRRQGVGPGDVFLFWGTYRTAETRAGRWRLVGPTRHLIYGWLQVAEMLALGHDGSAALNQHPWLDRHPHPRPGWDRLNTLFIAADRLRIAGLMAPHPGWGVLSRGFDLSKPGENPSVWSVPSWLHPASGGCGMTYHPPPRWLPGLCLACAPRGQEFVADVGKDARVGAWIETVLASA